MPFFILGDIVISFDFSIKSSALLGIKVENIFCVLITHGLTHLLNFDHELNNSETLAQAVCEMEILDCAGLDPFLVFMYRKVF